MIFEPKDRLIVALDVETLDKAEQLVDQLRDYCSIFKVGPVLLFSEGMQVLDMFLSKGVRVFLDMKFHDIPNTIAEVGKAIVKRGVFMYTVHTTGGKEMMGSIRQTTIETHKESSFSPPLIIGVTVLTSIDEDMLMRDLGVMRPLEDQVLSLAMLARQAGLDGVVASPMEVAKIRETCGPDFLIVAPGIRLCDGKTDDHRRKQTPSYAIQSGADFIVVGRPIIESPQPSVVAEAIIKEIEAGV